MPRRIRLPIVLCALVFAVGLAMASASAGASPRAHAAAGCSESSLASLRGGYFLPGKIRGVGCSTVRAVEIAWQNCRLKGGVKGHCHAKVLGFTCKESRPASQAGPGNFVAKMSCTKGSKSIAYIYLQNTL
jgi:hypothetical protein